jgi:hypothetical protein
MRLRCVRHDVEFEQPVGLAGLPGCEHCAAELAAEAFGSYATDGQFASFTNAPAPTLTAQDIDKALTELSTTRQARERSLASHWVTPWRTGHCASDEPRDSRNIVVRRRSGCITVTCPCQRIRWNIAESALEDALHPEALVREALERVLQCDCIVADVRPAEEDQTMADDFKIVSSAYSTFQVSVEELARERDRMRERVYERAYLGEQKSELEHSRTHVRELERKLNSTRLELDLATQLLKSKGRVFEPARIEAMLAYQLRSTHGQRFSIRIDRVSSASNRYEAVCSCSACKAQFIGKPLPSGPPAGVFVFDDETRLAIGEWQPAELPYLEAIGELRRHEVVVRVVAERIASSVRPFLCSCVRDHLALRDHVVDRLRDGATTLAKIAFRSTTAAPSSTSRTRG